MLLIQVKTVIIWKARVRLFQFLSPRAERGGRSKQPLWFLLVSSLQGIDSFPLGKESDAAAGMPSFSYLSYSLTLTALRN